MRSAVSFFLSAILCVSAAAQLTERPKPEVAKPQGAGLAPNSDATYQTLRHLDSTGESISVSGLTLKRDAGTFTFRSGTFSFTPPVEGKVTGAVFVGDGGFSLEPPIPVERKSLQYLTKEPKMDESFTELVLRFTDGTYDEIKKAGTPGGAAVGGGLMEDSNKVLRDRLRYNLHARILQEVLSKEPGGLFWAFIRGKRYNGKEIFMIDPHGVPELRPEEVAFMTYDENKYGFWAVFHLSSEYASGKANGKEKNGFISVQDQKLDTTIEKSGRIEGRAITTFTSLTNGLRVVPFDLYRHLRVDSVADGSGTQLPFIQEDKEKDYDFNVILPRPLAAGETFTLQTSYAGPNAIQDEGGGNYFPVARENWYPNTYFGDYSTYEITFRVPKGMKIIGSGSPAHEVNEGNQTISEWRSEVPQAVAGFNLGRMKVEQAKMEKENYVVESYANDAPPDWITNIQHIAEGTTPEQMGETTLGGPQVALGTMSTTGLSKKALAEAEAAVQIYTDYFGPAPYKRVAITQQTACNFGQAWPALVYLPICSYFDDNVKHQLGLLDGRGYWNSVTAHEVAHQWWGHAVGFNSYRDQWMSEGFAEESASIFLQLVYAKEPKKFQKFWSDQRELLTEKSRAGYRAIDVAPLTLGYRANNSKTGVDITRRLIYPKGGYVLHMIRMMMWDNRNGDANFKALMRDFVQTYMNRPASTEDFKAMVEKHMTQGMDLDGNHKMDWFFDPWVYGTTYPDYNFSYTFDKGADGSQVLKFKLTQSNVDDQFIMLVPIYLELANGRVTRLGNLPIQGNRTVEQSVPLGGLKDPPKRAMINYYYDVLCSQNK